MQACELLIVENVKNRVQMEVTEIVIHRVENRRIHSPRSLPGPVKTKVSLDSSKPCCRNTIGLPGAFGLDGLPVIRCNNKI